MPQCLFIFPSFFMYRMLNVENTPSGTKLSVTELLHFLHTLPSKGQPSALVLKAKPSSPAKYECLLPLTQQPILSRSNCPHAQWLWCFYGWVEADKSWNCNSFLTSMYEKYTQILFLWSLEIHTVFFLGVLDKWQRQHQNCANSLSGSKTQYGPAERVTKLQDFHMEVCGDYIGKVWIQWEMVYI